jgi:hypothetical protein
VTTRRSRLVLAVAGIRDRRPLDAEGTRSSARWYAALLVASLVGIVLAGCGGGESSNGVENAIPRLDGEDLPTSLLGSYTDSGEPTIGWHFLPAGDPFCRETVQTEQSCLRITGPDRTVDYGPVVVAGDHLLIALTYDENGKCLRKWRPSYTSTPQHLDLHQGVCGAPRGGLIPGAPPS